MSATLRRRIEQLEQDAAPEGYWALPLAAFYGEDMEPVWIDGTRRRGLDDFYRDLETARCISKMDTNRNAPT